MGGPQHDFSIRSFRIQSARDVAQLEIAEGIANGYGASGKRTPVDTAIAGGAVDATLDLGKGDVPEAVGDVGGASNARHIDVAVIVVNDQVAADVTSFDAAERSGAVGGRGGGAGDS